MSLLAVGRGGPVNTKHSWHWLRTQYLMSFPTSLAGKCAVLACLWHAAATILVAYLACLFVMVHLDAPQLLNELSGRLLTINNFEQSLSHAYGNINVRYSGEGGKSCLNRVNIENARDISMCFQSTVVTWWAEGHRNTISPVRGSLWRTQTKASVWY